MKKLLLYFTSSVALMSLAVTSVSCNDDDKNTWEDYEGWRNANTDFYEEQKFAVDKNGNPEYITVVAPWNPGAEVLIKYLSDRSLTEGNLVPMLTSTVDVKYRGMLANNVAFDSSY
ncbi:MAG: FKBP-type peptidyl-prolyl cis-trans isomerase, partial [Duncaniella sp.]|nr:FKBP-type peptidyl-prolyl cis-trans isomerase [Duncaniella sp.]